ncbi:MAG: type II toxin-antitoxin system PemK/MazF family toxin [Clostridiales Family XIII bacterium]|jgi:mRNA interferase MazF|nr:type II toxin-antitoxin system PemK/MazF family toxin [Clostridiales Family XIII bacterium]
MSEYEPKQGDIIRLNFDPQAGHEQAGMRPAVIVSNNSSMKHLNTRAMVCPITNTDKGFPVHIRLDSRTKTTGVVLCDQAKILDLAARKAAYVESLPEDILEEIVDVIIGMVEID